MLTNATLAAIFDRLAKLERRVEQLETENAQLRAHAAGTDAALASLDTDVRAIFNDEIPELAAELSERIDALEEGEAE